MHEEMKKYSSNVRELSSQYGKVLISSVLLLGIIVTLVSIFFSTRTQLLEISFLDVGQGDAIFIRTPSGHKMLIDGGVSNKVLEKISKKIYFFDREIDVIIATHPDADHITGLIPVLEKYTVKQIVHSQLTGQTGVSGVLQKSVLDEQAEVHVAQKGDEINFGDGVIAQILYPLPNQIFGPSETNDASVSVVLTYGEESILLTGDLPSTHEGDLLGKTLPRKITIYKAGHHGSKYSSSEQLLSYMKPEYTVISAGKDNSYGHPNQEALTRIQMYSKEILSTIDKGTISFFLNGTSVEIRTEK
jgi:competence protein ComEC